MNRRTMTDRNLGPIAGNNAVVTGGIPTGTRTTAHVWNVRHQVNDAADQNNLPELQRLATMVEGAYDATGDHRYAALLDDCETAVAAVRKTTGQAR